MRPLVLVLALIAADDRYGFTGEHLTEAAFNSVRSGLFLPQPTKELRALPAEARATAVTTLGKAVRGIVESQAFKDRYRAYVAQQRPKAPQPKRTYDQVIAEVKKQVAEQKAAAEKSLAQVEATQRKQLRAKMDEAYAAQLELYKDREMVEMMETQRVVGEQMMYDEALKRFPDDLTVRLREVLAKFLADTDGVDYAAKTVPKDGKQKFANVAYEGKNGTWKAAYRAGKPATEAARAFAREWMSALGK
ncbi:MAG: hypothetical protein ACAI38_24450 [Myxococcota bacterium]|nr:hypothetical protein [Myxococcota bacterium]